MLAAHLRAPETAFRALGFLLPPIAVLAPKAVVVLLVAGAALALLGLWLRSEPLQRIPRLPSLLIALLLLWFAAASSWSPDPARAVLLSLRLAGLFAAALALFAVARGLPNAARRRIALALTLGLALGIVLMIEERLFGAPLMALLHGDIDNEYHRLSRLNRGATALAILSWPVAALLWRERLGPWALGLPFGLLLGLLAFESTAALLGLAGGLAVALLATLSLRTARVLLILTIVAALAGGSFIARGFFAAGLSEASWLQSTARHRVHVWNFAAERVLERPLLGWGFDAARNIPAQGAEPYRSKTKVMPLHPHNAALQINLELGVPGTVLVALLLAAMIAGTVRLTREAGPAALGMAATAMLIALTAYGIWQNQWFALLALAVVMTRATAASDAPS